MKLRNIIFNSDEDYWNNTSTLNEIIIGKKQLVFLIEDDNGERFGYYSNNSLQEIYLSLQQADNKSFHFNLNSNGRLSKPMKFEIKNLKRGYYYYPTHISKLIDIGDITLHKHNWKQKSTWLPQSDYFMYHELQNSCYEKEIHLLSFLSHFVSFKRNNYYHLKMYQYKLKKNNKNSSKLKFILKYHEK